jgi:hypothetical protein
MSPLILRGIAAGAWTRYYNYWEAGAEKERSPKSRRHYRRDLFPEQEVGRSFLAGHELGYEGMQGPVAGGTLWKESAWGGGATGNNHAPRHAGPDSGGQDACGRGDVKRVLQRP